MLSAPPLVLEPETAACPRPARPDEEWYTPKVLLDAVKAVLGTIDLDPASCDVAQLNVQARTYYTKAQDGLRSPWHGKIFLNPPYHVPVIDFFCTKLLRELDAGHTTEAILLVKSITHIPWFQLVSRHAQVICFVERKRRFVHATKDGKSPVHGQALLYFGTHVQRFCEVFEPLGRLMQPLTIPAPGAQLTFADAQEIRPCRFPHTAAERQRGPP
jgi:ParB family transcriptional regulator, chromosome partitioning protein